jgi:DNA-binding response OmpR family regulator
VVGEGSVLIIDDDAMSRRLVSSHLEKFFEVAWAPTAQAGRAKYFRNPSDIVIVEYRLPDCSGLDLVRELRDENEEVQIVMATRYGSEQVCASAFRLGVHDYLSKPVAEAELVATVRRLLHRVKSRKTSAVAAVPPVCADRRLQLVAEQIHDGYDTRGGTSTGHGARTISSKPASRTRRSRSPPSGSAD